MFNYRAVISDPPRPTVITDGVDRYFVRSPMISGNKPIEAKVVAPKGLAVSYNIGDVVILGELEPNEYIILGQLQSSRAQSSNKLRSLFIDEIDVVTGQLGSSVSLSNQKTISTLLTDVQQLQSRVSELETLLRSRFGA